MAEGDVLTAFLFNCNSRTITSPPTGWTSRGSVFFGGDSRLYVYTKDATDSEPSTYAWTWSSTFVLGGGFIVRNTGAAATTDNTPDADSDGSSGSGGNLTCDAVTVSDDESLVLYACYVALSSSTITPTSTGLTEYQGGGSGSIRVSYKTANAGSSGTEAWTYSASFRSAGGATIALAPGVTAIDVEPDSATTDAVSEASSLLLEMELAPDDSVTDAVAEAADVTSTIVVKPANAVTESVAESPALILEMELFPADSSAESVSRNVSVQIDGEGEDEFKNQRLTP